MLFKITWIKKIKTKFILNQCSISSRSGSIVERKDQLWSTSCTFVSSTSLISIIGGDSCFFDRDNSPSLSSAESSCKSFWIILSL